MLVQKIPGKSKLKLPSQLIKNPHNWLQMTNDRIFFVILIILSEGVTFTLVKLFNC